MKRWLRLSVLALGCGLQFVSTASAQLRPAPQIGQYQQPGGGYPIISPMLNMARGGNPAINYYGLVQPQVDTSRNLAQLQQQFQQLDSGALQPGSSMTTAGPTAGSMLATGHPVAFMNYAAYFPLYARGAGGGGMMRGNTGGLGGVGMGGVGMNPYGFGAGPVVGVGIGGGRR